MKKRLQHFMIKLSIKWIYIEHKIYYKFEGNAPQYISRDLRECSEIVSMLDAKMLQLNEAIIEARAAQEEDTDAV